MGTILLKIKDFIKYKEGCCLTVYADSRGIFTIGYGHKIIPDDGLFAGDIITQERADDFFDHDFYWVLSGVKQLVPGFDRLHDNVKVALCDMAYNNGLTGLAKFRKFLTAINTNNLVRAKEELIDSDNFRSRDLHGRYLTLVNLIEKAIV